MDARWKHKNFYIEAEMTATLNRLAERMDLSASQVVRLALKQFFAQKRQRRLLEEPAS